MLHDRGSSLDTAGFVSRGRDAARAQSGSQFGGRSLIRIDGRKLWNGLVLATLLLWLMHLVVVVSLLFDSPIPASNRFHLDVEGNLPTFMSTLNLLISAALLGLIAVAKKKDRDRFALHWTVLASVFFLLSVDEAASIHELSAVPIRDALGLTGYLERSWVLAGGAFVVAFAYAYSRFLLALPRSTAGMFLLCGGLFVAGTIGFEMVSAEVFEETHKNRWQYMAATTLEEVLEMSAILLFVRTLLAYLRRYCVNFTLHLV